MSRSGPRAAADFRIEPLGDQALLLTFGERIDPELNDRVHRLAALIRAEALPGVRDLVPAYATLAVHYDPSAWAATEGRPQEALIRRILAIGQNAAPDAVPVPRQVRIPVCYGGAAGPDLTAVANACRLSEAEVIARHTAAEYRVYMLGFAPGFAYLGGLDPSIASPRRETPRLKVPAGSVGIAGQQTGIYPLETPGGWQIIGRTARRLFRPDRAEPCLLQPGDRLRFVAVDPGAVPAGLED